MWLFSRLSLLLLATLSFCGCNSSSNSDVTYVALGASDATGVGATPLTNGYVYRIRDMLENDGYPTNLDNLGVPGIEIGGIVDVEKPLATRANPDLITLFTGGNDLVDGTSASDFQEKLDGLIADLQGTNAFIVIADLPDLTRLPRFIDDPDSDVTPQNVAAYNAAINAVANKYGIPVARLSSEAPDDRYVSDEDGFHPNDQGHKRMAELFYAIIGPYFAQTGSSGD
ncbi:MAG: hypothetical protein J0M12_02120 [Deltaproteobacteria bacterium]|nr:hypothetical protein [Deltaproteobacteria bacterium]